MGAQIFVGALLLSAALAAHAGQDVVETPTAFRFGGGEKIHLIIVPDPGGGPIDQIVTDDGYIALPTGGDPINIKGKSITEAQKAISERVQNDSGARAVKSAIALLSVPVRSIYVGGEGIKTGVSISVGNGTPMTLYAAILSAGGATTEGDLSRVTLSHTLPDGKVATQVYDASKFGEASTHSLGPVLEPGDVVKVPRSEVLILAGEFNRAGPLNLRELIQNGNCLRASCAIYASGGLRPGANRKSIKLLRETANGQRKAIPIDLDAAERSSETASSEKGAPPRENESDPIVKNGDIIVVSQGGGIPVLGKVRLPGIYPINGQTVKLSRIIAQAGGFADYAKTSSVTIVKASGGTLHVDMGKIQNNGFQDMELEDGDIIYVGERLL